MQLGVLEKEEWLYRALHGRKIIFSTEINSKKTILTYGFDVSKGIASVMGVSHALGETFHITANEKNSKTWNEILEVYLSVLEKYLGHKTDVQLQNLEKFIEFRSNDSKYQVIYDRLYNRKFNCQKISQYTNIDSFEEIESGLTYCLVEFLKKPLFKNINWQMEAKRDRQTGERTPLTEINGIKQKMKYLFFRFLKS